MAEVTSWCRGCDELCGVIARVEEGRLLSLAGDSGHPVTRGWDCAGGRQTPARLVDPHRWLEPRFRRGGSLEEGSWDEVLGRLLVDLRGVIARGGPGSVGILLGARAARSTRTLLQLEHLRRLVGPVRVLGPRATSQAPWRHATRHVLGEACTLRADLARAQHVLLLGAEQWETGWEQGYAGQALRLRLEGGYGLRNPHLTTADPRCTALAERARVHLQLRCGTELYLVLGMISAVLRGGWWDRHHIDAQAQGMGDLEEAMAPWSVARTAALCGLQPADVTAEAMRFARAATAVVHVAPHVLGTPFGGLIAWATLVLELLTGNALKPGGLYAPAGPGDQAPDEEPDEGLLDAVGRGMEALVCLEADPVTELPGRGLDAALGALPVLACLDTHAHATSRIASYALPVTCFPEESDLVPRDGCDRHWVQWTPALVPPSGGCRPPHQLLASLGEGLCRGWGHRKKHGHSGAALDTRTLERVQAALGVQPEALARGVGVGATRAPSDPRGFDGGPVDRARWAVAWPSGRVRLLPPAFKALLARHVPAPEGGAWPLWLFCGARPCPARGRSGDGEGSRTPRLLLHPDAGLRAGSRVRVITAFGIQEATAVLDPGLRPDCAQLPPRGETNPFQLADPAHRDALGGRVWTHGQPCRIERVGGASSDR